MKEVYIIPFVFVGVSWITTGLALLTPNALEKKLCTLEDMNARVTGYDPLGEAYKLLLREGHSIGIKRSFIYPQDVLEIVTRGSGTTEIQWSRCHAILIRAQCSVASMLTDWLQELTLDERSRPRIVISEPNFLPCRISAKDVLQLAGPLEAMRSVAKILLHDQLRLRKVVLIHDNTMSPEHLTNLLLAMSDYSILEQVLEIQTLQKDQNLTQGLLNAVNADTELHIMLCLSEPHMYEILHQAKVLNLLQSHHYWVLLTSASCADALGEAVPAESNVLLVLVTHVLRRDMLQPPCVGHMLDDTADLNTRKLHLLATGIYLALGSTGTKQMAGDTMRLSICDTHQALLTGSIVQTESKLSLWTADGNVTFDLATGLLGSAGFQVCSTDQYSHKNYSLVATWSKTLGLQVLPGSLFRNLFRDFSHYKKKLKVSTREAAPFVMRKRTENGTEYEGFCIDILNELAARLSFSYTIVEVEDHKWGSRDENGRWNGVVGEVSRWNADFGVGPFSFMSEREEVVDYTSPIADEGTSFMMMKPGLDSSTIFQLFRPFQPIVWLFLCVMTLTMMTTIFFVERSSPFSGQKRRFWECVWAVYGYAVGQGTSFDLNSASARLALGCFWIVIIIITSSYTAELAAVLTVNTQQESINSIAELASQSDIKPLIELGSNLETLFNTAATGVYRDIARMMTNMPKVTDSVEARELVEQNNMAYISDKSQIEYLVKAECNKFVSSKTIFNTGALGFIVPKGAPYLDAFSGIIVKLSESGILDEWRRKWWSHEGLSCKPQARLGTGKNLAVIYLAGPFFVFVGAAGCGFLLAAVEVVWKTDRFQRLVKYFCPKRESGQTVGDNRCL